MHGTFNGLPLDRIIALKKLLTGGVTRTTVRVLGSPSPELEKRLRMNEPALLILPPRRLKGGLSTTPPREALTKLRLSPRRGQVRPSPPQPRCVKPKG